MIENRAPEVSVSPVSRATMKTLAQTATMNSVRTKTFIEPSNLKDLGEAPHLGVDVPDAALSHCAFESSKLRPELDSSFHTSETKRLPQYQPLINMPPSPPMTPPLAKAELQLPTSPAPASKCRTTSMFPKFYHNGLPMLVRRTRPRTVYHGCPKLATQPVKPLSRVYAAQPPQYMDARVGDPCSLDSLDHVLGCGHRIITVQPEPCGTNCHIREQPDYSQPRDIEAKYVCMECIANQLEARHEGRYLAYRSLKEDEAEQLGEDEKWIEAKLERAAEAWRDLDTDEIERLSKGHKRAYPFSWDRVPSDWREMIASALQAHGESLKRASSLRARTAASARMKRGSVASVTSTTSFAGSTTPSRTSTDRTSIMDSPAGTNMPSHSRSSTASSEQWRQYTQGFFKTKSITSQSDEW